MNNLHRNLLATACVALLGAAATVSTAQAANCNGDTNCSLGSNPYSFGSSDIYGGGSSLIAPYWRQTSDCWAAPADLITKGNPPTYVDEEFYNESLLNCSTPANSGFTSWYTSTGSGAGILGVFGHDPVSFWGQVNTNGPQFFPEVFYANSDAGLGTTDTTAYNSGGVYHQSTTTITINAPGVSNCTNTNSSPYPSPVQCYGPLVQFPLSIDPIAIFYANGGVYEKILGSGNNHPEVDYKLNVQGGNANGGLRLSVNSLCGIFNGTITNWNDPSLTADNNNTSLEDTHDGTASGSWGVPLIPVARSDSSGTTSIQTRHLANVCASFGTNLYTTGATTISAAGAGSIVGQTYNVNSVNYPGVDTAGLITLAPNSSGVAQYVAFTQAVSQYAGQNLCPKTAKLPSGYNTCIQQGRVGYVGADYVLPYVNASQTNDFNLFSADVQNAAGNYVAVSPAGASAAFGSVLPPQTLSTGKYCATCTTTGHRNNPLDWVEGLSPTVPLANPSGGTSYPIVGTTNMITYSCFANAANLANLSGEINFQETAKATTNAKKSILAVSGLSPLPKAWYKAIDDAFIVNKDKLNLQLAVVAKNGTTPACETVFNNGGPGA